MNRFASTLAVTAILAASLGFAAPAEAAPWKYDCDTSGYTQCTNPILGDVWESFDALKNPPHFSDTHVLRYVKTYHKYPMVGKNSIVVKSIHHVKTWYVLSYTK